MPKRKIDEDFKYLKQKLEELERKMKNPRRKRVRVLRSSSSSSSEPSPRRHARRSKSRDQQPVAPTAPIVSGCDPDRSDDLVQVLYGPPSTYDLRSLPPPPADKAATAVSSVAVAAPAPAAPATTLTAPVLPIRSNTVGPSVNTVANEAPMELTQPDAENALDDDLMEILGLDPTNTDTFGPDMHKEVARRFEHYATSGLTTEARKELMDAHRIPTNCKLVNAPTLNPEIKAALSAPIANRDKAIEGQQKILASAISSLGSAITLLLSCDEKQPELLRLLINTGRLLCDRQHKDSETRRRYVLSSLKADFKEQMKTTQIDNLLFGQNFQETLKTAKTINKSGADLKQSSSFARPKTNQKPTPSTSKNWKSSYQSRKQAAAPKSRGTMQITPPATTRTPRASSSRGSQRPRVSRR